MAQSKFNFQQVLSQLQQVQKELPVLLANQAKNHFLDQFKEQGWEGAAWQEVKRRIPGTPEYKWPQKPKASSRTNPILVRSGKLRRAVSNSIRSATFKSVRLVVDLPYAKRHNEGLDGMPERRYMGDSPALRAKQQDTINKYINKIWK